MDKKPRLGSDPLEWIIETRQWYELSSIKGGYQS